MRRREMRDYEDSFADRLYNILAEKKISNLQLDLDDICSPATISKWLHGETLPTAYTLERLCKYLGVSADYLLGLSDRKPLTAKWFFYDGECLCGYCGARGETIFSFCPNCGTEMEVDNENN